MNVAQLIEKLESMPLDAEVHFAYDYGDYWHTSVAPEVVHVYEGQVEWSEYHRMPKVVESDQEWDTEDNEEEPTEQGQPVVLIG